MKTTTIVCMVVGILLGALLTCWLWSVAYGEVPIIILILMSIIALDCGFMIGVSAIQLIHEWRRKP